MLRISIEQGETSATVTLEGRIAGLWAAELRRVWTEFAPTLAKRKLALDLRNTTYADASGLAVLREIYSDSAAQLVAGTPWTEYLAQEIMRQHATQME